MSVDFDEIWLRAVERHGEERVARRLPETPKTPAELAATPDDRWLSMATKGVFAAGFRWNVVQAKWDGFEEAFHGFDVPRVATLSAEELGALQADTRIIRNGQKIHATVENARWMQGVAQEHGSFGRWVASWPADDVIGLWDALKQQGARLGGMTGPRFLRHMGVDSFLLTDDVVGALTDHGLMTAKPTSKTGRKQAQSAFLAWREQTGRPLGQLSTVLSMSYGKVYDD